MRILVVGGTHFVGRAIAEVCVAQGDEVTVINRGNQPPPVGVRSLIADRRVSGSVHEALAGEGDWDLAFDPWSLEPRVVAESCSALADRVGHFTYISTRSVYGWPIAANADEWASTVDGDPDSGDFGDYAADKRGAEFAAIREFGGRCLIARPGLILGPHELIGRLPYWLERAQAGGEILAPGTVARPLQYIDARDLALFVRALAGQGVSDIFDTVSQPGHARMGEVIDAVDGVVPPNDRRFTWVDEAFLVEREVSGWSDVPIWGPQLNDLDSLHNSNVNKAYAAGLRCRPFAQTCADTWSWLQGRPDHVVRSGFLARSREVELLAEWGERSSHL